jgi:hypothetical protein
MSELNIYQRINKVMQDVRYAQKDATVQGYKAVTHDQVVSVARSSFVKHGIVITPSQTSGAFDDAVEGSKMRLYTGFYIISFVNMDKPDDKIEVNIEAQALDNGDKGPGKCLTYATKSAVIKVLWLETGENDESRVKDQETISETQVQQLLESVDAAGLTLSDFCDSAKIESLDEMQAHRFKPAKAHLNKLKAKKEEATPDA